MQNDAETADHPFLVRPHRTLLGLMLPVLLSLVAEPLTGLVDTAFIARFGAAPPPNRSALCHLSRTEFTGVQVIFAI
jgi:Na+-driven multidrug efflux pump